MFGSDEGPWKWVYPQAVSRRKIDLTVALCPCLSHSFRFEHKLGPRLKVVALIDPATARAEAVLAGKRASFVESAYRDTVVYKTVEDFRDAVSKDKEPQWVGIRYFGFAWPRVFVLIGMPFGFS
jgi:hypothetical protein